RDLPLRLPAADDAHPPCYSGCARRHRCCPTHPIGPRYPRAEPLNRQGVPPIVSSTAGKAATKILIVGGGYAGFYPARKLAKHLRRGEAEVTMVDPLPYMTYQPFLPEVAAGSNEARHAVVAHRRRLKRTNVVTAKVTGIDHANRAATITPPVGDPWAQEYDQIVVT